MKRYWKALLIVLVLSAQPTPQPVGSRNGGSRSARRYPTAAEGFAFALGMTWAASTRWQRSSAPRSRDTPNMEERTCRTGPWPRLSEPGTLEASAT